MSDPDRSDSQTVRGPLRVLVVDDERLGRKRLTDLLADEPDLVVVGAATTGEEAVDLIQRFAPDVVFLDIQMPGLSGLDIAARVGDDAMPVTVFVTAHGTHALRAFDLAAVDYLLKPFDDDRFRVAVGRARAAVTARTAAQSPPPGTDASYLKQIAVDVRGTRRFLTVERVEYVTADGPYALLHTTDGEQFVVREQMQAFEARLDPAVFFRTHRSAIVRLSAVEAFLTGPAGDYAVRLHTGTRVRVARSRRDALLARLQSMG